MIEFAMQAKRAAAVMALSAAVVMPGYVSSARAQTATQAPQVQAAQPQGNIPMMPEEPGAPGAPSAPPSSGGTVGTGGAGAALDGPPGTAGVGPGGDAGKGPGRGPQAPDSIHVGAPGAPGAPSGPTATGEVPTLYAPLGTHLQQTLDVGKPPVAFDVRISGQTSVVHVGLGDAFTLTEEGILAGKLMLEGLENKDINKIKESQAVLKRIIPMENFGGEYTALEWFTDYMLAAEADKPKFIEDPLDKIFFDFYAENEWTGLKEYLSRKYHLRDLGDEYSKEGRRRKADLEHTMVFNNPRRETWERTSKLLALMKFKPGMLVADIGSGAGYYTFKVSKLVGDTGKVFAIEMEEDRIAYIQRVADQLGIKNIENVRTDGMDLGLGGRQVDVAMMVSLYHNIYAMSTARERNSLIKDIRKSLKPDGRLIIADNAVVPPGTVPYHGPYVAKELIVAQMVNFGFKLVDMQQYIPQRYILVFQLDDAPTGQSAQPSSLKPGALPVEFSTPIEMAPLHVAPPPTVTPAATAPADASKTKN